MLFQSATGVPNLWPEETKFITARIKTMAIGNPIEFIRQVRQELSRVTFPSRKETTVSTIMVFVMVFISAVFLFIADQVIAFLIQLILG
jgi:preprotein translocase subunit SecE